MIYIGPVPVLWFSNAVRPGLEQSVGLSEQAMLDQIWKWLPAAIQQYYLHDLKLKILWSRLRITAAYSGLICGLYFESKKIGEKFWAGDIIQGLAIGFW